jgi:hypothetical protein
MAADMPFARWSLLSLLILTGVSLLLALQPRPHEGDPVLSLSGKVREQEVGLPEVRVRLKGTSTSTLTDHSGGFRLAAITKDSPRLTAWKDGYFIAGLSTNVSPLTMDLTRLPAADNEHYAWVDPTPDAAREQNCGNCHRTILEEWRGSGHSHSVRNRHFLNVYDGSDWLGRRKTSWNLLAEHPDGSGVCTACHAPTIPFDDPAYFDVRQAKGPAAQGVHCDYCHKVAGAQDGVVGLTHGRFGLRLLRPTEGQLFLGPLDDVDRDEDSYSPFFHDSRYCASCHEGTVFGVHVYSTYSEWLNSPARKAGKHCQDCHMAPTGHLTNLAPGRGGIQRDPQTLASHSFFAGSLVEMLRRCLLIRIQLTAKEQGLSVEVAVRTDQVGHRVPTGFIDRNLILLVEAWDRDGRPVAPQAGSAILPGVSGPGLAGRAGRLFAKQASDFDGRVPVPFWLARPETTDSRLMPGQEDRSSYQFAGNVDRMRLRVLYRRFWQQVAVAKGWPDNELVVVDQSLQVGDTRAHHWQGP